jgi:hypothetical protein
VRARRGAVRDPQPAGGEEQHLVAEQGESARIRAVIVDRLRQGAQLLGGPEAVALAPQAARGIIDCIVVIADVVARAGEDQ